MQSRPGGIESRTRAGLPLEGRVCPLCLQIGCLLLFIRHRRSTVGQAHHMAKPRTAGLISRELQFTGNMFVSTQSKETFFSLFLSSSLFFICDKPPFYTVKRCTEDNGPSKTRVL